RARPMTVTAWAHGISSGRIRPRQYASACAPRLCGMPVRDLTAADFRAYRTMSSGAFGGAFDPAAPQAPQDFSPGETAIGVDSSALPGGVAGVIAAGARIRHDRIALGGGIARCGGIGGLA